MDGLVLEVREETPSLEGTWKAAWIKENFTEFWRLEGDPYSEPELKTLPTEYRQSLKDSQITLLLCQKIVPKAVKHSLSSIGIAVIDRISAVWAGQIDRILANSPLITLSS
jgi:hypothetical protein